VTRPTLLVALVALGAAVGHAEDDSGLSQLWVDHAVADADHVLEGDYEGGSLTVSAELAGPLGKKVVPIERGDVELGKDDLVQGAQAPGGHGVFFLQDRMQDRTRLVQRLIGWQGAAGVAWIRSDVYFYRPSSEDPDRLAPARVCTERAFRDAIARAFERREALTQAVATLDTGARVGKLSAIVLSPREAPADVLRELGGDPFVERALVAVAGCGSEALGALADLRDRAPQPWIRINALRLFGTTGAEPQEATRRLEKIAADPGASQEEVVTAIDMLFDREASLELLEKLSHDTRVPVRRSVAMTLRERVTDLKLLERLMDDDDASVRERARVSARAAAHRLGLPDPTR
jgi:hypothetical protein